MGKESKKQGLSVWLRPDTITRMDSLLTLDNCSSRSEFVDKAVRFYIGYLTSEDVSEYLSQALVAALKGSLDENSNRQRALLFKLCVEVNMLCHTMAAHYRADEIDRRGLRAFAVREVKDTNGQISFDHALDVQRQLPPEADDDWPG